MRRGACIDRVAASGGDIWEYEKTDAMFRKALAKAGQVWVNPALRTGGRVVEGARLESV